MNRSLIQSFLLPADLVPFIPYSPNPAANKGSTLHTSITPNEQRSFLPAGHQVVCMCGLPAIRGLLGPVRSGSYFLSRPLSAGRHQRSICSNQEKDLCLSPAPAHSHC